MALREEFEYVSFRCCYCFTLNPARKLRVAAPKLEATKIGEDAHESTSESERNSPSDSDSDVELIKDVEKKEEESPNEKSNELKKED